MKVTFDSNTWRQVASPNNFPKDPINSDYRTIRNAIDKGIIVPFISETIFTLEAIKKVDRKQFFKDYKPVTTTDIVPDDHGGFKIQFKIGPNDHAHPGNNEFLKEHLSDAIKLGFNIIYLPRIAGITNKDIENLKYKMDSSSLSNYQKKVFEAGRRISSLGAGETEIKQLVQKYFPAKGFDGIGDLPESEKYLIAKAVSEWADGDSVACHIAIGGDYFCSRDQAIKAGNKSIFDETNLIILNKEYGFKKVNPTELVEIINKL